MDSGYYSQQTHVTCNTEILLSAKTSGTYIYHCAVKTLLHNFRAVLWLAEGDQFMESSGLPDLLVTRKDSVMVAEW